MLQLYTTSKLANFMPNIGMYKQNNWKNGLMWYWLVSISGTALCCINLFFPCPDWSGCWRKRSGLDYFHWRISWALERTQSCIHASWAYSICRTFFRCSTCRQNRTSITVSSESSSSALLSPSARVNTTWDGWESLLLSDDPASVKLSQ